MVTGDKPKALLFDIGGVCVVSPFQAILDYELANNIPPGWVNYSISKTSPDGSWHKLERGKIKLDADFFKGFSNDLHRPDLWKAFQSELREKAGSSQSAAADPPVPKVEAEWLFWEMMRMSQTPDPFMYPALLKLKASGQFIIAALSNTVIYPDGHPYQKKMEQGIFKNFDVFVSSAHTGLRKPDPEVYQVAMKKINEMSAANGRGVVEPEDVVFLDDIGENLKWGKKAGLRTIRVMLGKTEDAVKELEAITDLKLLDGNRARL